MSEFSASYHLKSNDKKEVVGLIKDSGNKGYVFDEENGWVTFLIEGPAFDINKSIIRFNPGILVHYVYGEDHGWELRVFDKGKKIFEYEYYWGEAEIGRESYDLSVIHDLVIDKENTIEDLEKIFYINDEDDNDDSEEIPAYQLAEMIGLTNYEWLSVDDMMGANTDEGILFIG